MIRVVAWTVAFFVGTMALAYVARDGEWDASLVIALVVWVTLAFCLGRASEVYANPQRRK